MKIIMEIELLSDMCVADGGVYNSLIDTDVCHDKYGFPYIPAKRLKGCIRESALELSDWGLIDREVIDRIFGKAGNKDNKGLLRIDNAFVESYEEKKQEILDNNSIVYHPQNVLNTYAYIRTQTSIDDETGVAKDNTLRNTRVVSKGNRFISNVCIDDGNCYDDFKKAAESVHNIGLARTRGLGEVKIKVAECNSTEFARSKKLDDEDELDGDTVLKYIIKLDEPMICKALNGGESSSMDYIEGAKVIGLLANQVGDNGKFKELMLDGDLIFSNAYLAINQERYTEVPAYIYSIKDNDTQYVNKLIYDRDKSNVDNETRQLNIMKHCYVSLQENGTLNKQSVNMEERYHHSRPDDKSVGHALEAEDNTESKFYQLSSIEEDQEFAGYIYGNRDEIAKVYEYLMGVNECYMGYGRSAEYGKCHFRISGAGKKDKKKLKGKEFVVTLNSPTILYNDKAMYSTDISDLKNAILKSLELDVDTAKCHNYVQFTSVGGYNVTWQEKKPVVGAFDKGSAIKIVFNETQELDTEKVFFIGERTHEGYGECRIDVIDADQNDMNWKILSTGHEYNELSADTKDSKADVLGELGESICNRLFDTFTRRKALQLVEKNKKLQSRNVSPTISNMMLMIHENDTINGVRENVAERYSKGSDKKKEKLKYAKQIIEVIEDSCGAILREFNNSFNVEYVLDEDGIKMKLLGAFLQELKYKIRIKKVAKGEQSNE